MNANEFVAYLSAVKLPAVFNPYADYCQECDRFDAAKLRRKNLQTFLEATLLKRVDTIWIARDLGYRGGRRTGIPLTDEIHLDRLSELLGGVKLNRATKGPAVAERTARVVWKMLLQIGEPVVLWNVFPFHPHEPGAPFTNRCHTSAEREITQPLLEQLISMFQPRQVVAIGRDAHQALRNIGVPVTLVRHPSYGGQAEFSASIRSLYGLRNLEDKNHRMLF